MCRYIVESPIGPLTIVSDGGALTALRFGAEKTASPSCPLLLKAAGQLQEYFTGQRRSFTVPLAPCGTVFQMKVWQALLQIPYGATASYRDIATRIGNPAACRAVGMANNRNPLPIFIPCHRVIGANGHLTGYAGGLQIKEHLLALEYHCITTQRNR